MTKTLRNAAVALAVAFAAVLPQNANAQEVKLIWEQSFQAATAGTEEAPEAFKSYGTGSFSNLFGYSWSQSKTMSAGGSVLVQDGGYIYRSTSASSSGGGLKVTAMVKAGDSYGGCVLLKQGSASTTIILDDNQWHEVSAIFPGGYGSTRLEPFLSAAGVFVKSMKVEQSASFLAAPVANQPTQADGTSFTATWRSVSGATAYFLDVYSYNGENKEYVVENLNVGKVTSYKVSDLDPAKTYYYVVRSTDGTAVSENSEEIRVVKVIDTIAAPEALAASGVDGTSFTANWKPVEGALGYLVNLYRKETLKEDAQVDIFSEDFTKITEGSFSQTEFGRLDVNEYTHSGGWDSNEFVLAGGALGLYPLTADVADLTLPALDLSGNNGTFLLKVTMRAGAYGTPSTDAKVAVKLLSAAGETLEEVTLTLDSEDYKQYKAAFTKGAADCKVQISYTKDAAKTSLRIFIDDIAVAQQMKAGQSVTKLVEIATEEGAAAASHKFNVEFADNVEYSYGVVAVAETVQAGEIVEISSDESNIIAVTSAGVEDIAVAQGQVAAYREAEGSLAVVLDSPATVNVYNAAGVLVASADCRAGKNNIAVVIKGLVFVAAGNKALKVIM